MPSNLIIFAVVILICGFAIRCGDRIIRHVAVWIFANIVLHALLSLGGIASPTLHLIDDGIYATGLLPLAFFSVSPWIGALAFLATGSFVLQSFYLLSDRQTDWTFVVINNLLTMSCLLTLVAATVVGIVNRRRLVGDLVPA
jgi:hypothetical protein